MIGETHSNCMRGVVAMVLVLNADKFVESCSVNESEEVHMRHAGLPCGA